MPKTFQKKLKRFIVMFIMIWMMPLLLYAQEFNCSVTVNDRQIRVSSYDHISELPNLLENYINGHRWTNDTYQPHERIVCNIQVMLTNVDSNLNFTSEVVFTIRRPVYDTNQQSLTLVLSDNNWRFNFPRGKSLIHDTLQFDDIASFMDYYAYIMLGFDYDSFSELGGTSLFSRAQSVLELGLNSGVAGWGRSIGAQRNRFGLINDIMNPSFEDLRKSYYRYHRLGLDQFTIDPEIARNQVLSSLDTIRDTKRVTTSNYLFDIFFSTKYTEIVAIFADAEVAIRTEAYNLLRDVDPAHTSEYQKLQN